MKPYYKLLTGMRDILPEETAKWQTLESILFRWIKTYAYSQIRTPLLESTELFLRSVGEETDIVGKEMYSFKDISSEMISLRPEGTVSTLRAVVENNYLYSGPKKLWYYGPMFRRERPQKGRYRQFHQFGVEALNFPGPDIDAEIILMCWDLWKQLRIQEHVVLEINSLGNQEERKQYKKELVAYLKQHESILDEDSKRRLLTNPLRVLDTKNPDLQEICNNAPMLLDVLNEESKFYFEKLKHFLDVLNIPFQVNPRLVRGLDYYNHTVFEWVTTKLGSQGTICAGGRYNGLVEELGGSSADSIGFAIGIERLLLLLDDLNLLKVNNQIDFYIISQNEDCLLQGLKYATILRSKGFSVYTHFGGQKIATQFKKADASRAKYALIIGENELTNQEVTLKDLRTQLGQKTINENDLLKTINEWMN